MLLHASDKHTHTHTHTHDVQVLYCNPPACACMLKVNEATKVHCHDHVLSCGMDKCMSVWGFGKYTKVSRQTLIVLL